MKALVACQGNGFEPVSIQVSAFEYYAQISLVNGNIPYLKTNLWELLSVLDERKFSMRVLLNSMSAVPTNDWLVRYPNVSHLRP